MKHKAFTPLDFYTAAPLCRWRGWFEGGTELATDFGRFRWRGRFMLEER